MKKLSLFFVIVLTCSLTALSQESVAGNQNPGTPSKQTEANFIKFLNKTLTDIEAVDTTNTRLQFRVQAANLFAQFDKNKSNQLVNRSKGEFTDYLKRQIGRVKARRENGVDDFSFLDQMISLPDGEGEGLQLLQLRELLTNHIAEVDAFGAYEFALEMDRLFGEGDGRAVNSYYPELRFWNIYSLMPRQDLTRSIQFTTSFITSDKKAEGLALIVAIYSVDQNEGRKLGEKFINFVLENIDEYDEDLNDVRELLDSKDDKNEGNDYSVIPKDLFVKESLKRLADKLAGKVLQDKGFAGYPEYHISGFTKSIGKFSPEKAKAISEKWKELNKKEDCQCAEDDTDKAKDTVRDAADRAADAVKNAADRAASAVNEDLPEERRLGTVERGKGKGKGKGKAFFESLSNFNEVYPVEEARKAFIHSAYDVIKNVKDEKKRLILFTELAKNISNEKDTSIAVKIMAEVNELTTNDPKTLSELFRAWRIVAGNSSADPAKSLSNLESIISRLNVAANTANTVHSFIGDEFAFLGDLPVAVTTELGDSIFKDLGDVDMTLSRLAEADFERLSKLENRVEDQKMKIALNLLILKSLHRSYYSKVDKDK